MAGSSRNDPGRCGGAGEAAVDMGLRKSDLAAALGRAAGRHAPLPPAMSHGMVCHDL